MHSYMKVACWSYPSTRQSSIFDESFRGPRRRYSVRNANHAPEAKPGIERRDLRVVRSFIYPFETSDADSRRRAREAALAKQEQLLRSKGTSDVSWIRMSIWRGGDDLPVIGDLPRDEDESVAAE